MVGQLLQGEDSAAGPGLDQPDQKVPVTSRIDQTGGFGLKQVPFQHQVDRRRRSLHAIEVKVEREGSATVDPGDLENPVAAQESVVGQRQEGLAGVEQFAVDAEPEHFTHRPSA